MAREWSADEIVRLALIYAIQDREAYADACHNDDTYGHEAARLAKEMRRYHKRRYKTEHLNEMERQMSQASIVSAFDVIKSK